jgi:cytochrome o ubiquinol oxidase operon protein cyoD
MSDASQGFGDELPGHAADLAPGEESPDASGLLRGALSYVVGLALAALLTAASFYFASSGLIYRPAIPAALTALAIAQMGVHLVFFLHLTSGPDNTNNALALAFGVLIVTLVIGGSLWIMANLNHNMAAMSAMAAMQP